MSPLGNWFNFFQFVSQTLKDNKMNASQINEFRKAHNLVPLTRIQDITKNAAKKRNADNKAKRAQECRELKASRASGRKVK